MATNPMHQFNVYRIGPEVNLGGVDISFTNAGLFMILSALTIMSLFFGVQEEKLWYLQKYNCSLNLATRLCLK